jgi:hypothetical protein
MTGYEVATQISLCCDTPPAGAMIYTRLKELDTGGYLDWKLAVVKGKMWKNYLLSVRCVKCYRASAQAWSSLPPQIKTAVKTVRHGEGMHAR